MASPSHRLPILSLLLLGALSRAAPARAQVGIIVHEVAAGGVRIDGSLRDWRRVRFVAVGRGADASMRFALGYDAQGLYLAASVRDDRMVRSARPGVDEDAVVLTLAMPAGRGHYRGSDLWLWAGVPGRSAARVGIAPVGGRRPRTLSAARIVEGPRGRGRGYVLEAHIPFSAIPGGSGWQGGRGTVRLVDVDSEAHPEVQAEPALSRVDPRHLERLPALEPTGGESAVLRRFLHSRDLEGTRPRHDLRGDVAGDGRPERIVVVARYVVVMGSGYRGGEAFDFFELPVVAAADVLAASLRDLTGDGKRELAVRLRQSNERGSRELWQVYRFRGERIRPLWGVELRKQTPRGFVEARLQVRRARRGPPRIDIRAGRAEGLDAASFHEAPAFGVEPILLPWGPTAERSYRWTGERFEVVSERENRDYEPPAEQASAPPAPREAQAPPAASSRADVIAEFLRRAGLPAGTRPRFRLRANVAADRRPEQVLIFGRHLLVVGPGFRGGAGWLDQSLPVQGDADVLEVRTADLSGDGRREILVRIRRRVGDVLREILLVHQIRPGGAARLLAVEVARRRGDRHIENVVRVVGRGRAARLEVRPGRARGWSAERWPFAPGSADGSVRPLLLPWRDRPVRYHFAGGRLVP